MSSSAAVGVDVANVGEAVDANSRAAAEYETLRVAVLHGFRILDTDPEAAFDDLTVLAARRCDVPMAVISFTDSDRLWVKSQVGWDLQDGARNLSLRGRLGSRTDLVAVSDVFTEPRLADHPLVVQGPRVRSFASAPLIADGKFVVGSLCVMDTRPRVLDRLQLEDLSALARQVMNQLELRRQSEELATEVAATLVAKAAVRDHELVLNAIVSQTDLNIYAKDLAGRYILANKPLLRKLGVEGDALGRTDHELFPPAAADIYRENDLRIAQTGFTEVFEEDFTTPDGDDRSYHSTKFALRNETGRIYAVAGVSLDVTELAGARKDRDESEQRWRALVEHSPVAVTVIGADGSFRYANARAVALLKVQSLEWLTGRSAAEFVATGKYDKASSLLTSLMQGGAPVQARRATMRTFEGDELTVEFSAAPITFDGRPALQIELRDVTEQAGAELALRISERRFHSVFEDSPVAMSVSDEAGRWVEANAAFGHLLGIDSAEMIGRTAHDFTDPADHHLIDRSEQGQRDSVDGVLRMELPMIRRSGERIVAWLSITPTLGPAGERWTLAVAQDITARMAAETALRESESDLLAIAAVARCVQSGDDPRPVVVASLRDLARASSVSIVEALDEATLSVTANVGTPAALIGTTLPLHQGSMTARAWQSGRPLFVPEVDIIDVLAPALGEHDSTISALWQPVIIHGEVEALLVVTWRERLSALDSRAARAVLVIADEAASSLQATRLLRELERSATTDPLTGSLNRRAWDARLRGRMNEAFTTGAPLTIAVVDLDYFKSYNDRYGHAAGDVVLSEFAAAARDCLRKDDVFARWGGEEFIVALCDCAPDEAEQILERIRMSVPVELTCSIGHANWDVNEPMPACIARADAALYDAKRLGRNRITAG